MKEHLPEMRQLLRRIHRVGHVRGYGGLKILVLYILSEEPKNGAELMETIELMTHGHWKPSPGSIYPLLSKAVEENQIIKREDRRYELTAIGYDEISMFKTGASNQSESVETILTDIDSNLSYLQDLSREKLAPYQAMLEKIGVKINLINASYQSPDDES